MSPEVQDAIIRAYMRDPEGIEMTLVGEINRLRKKQEDANKITCPHCNGSFHLKPELLA